MEDNVSLFIVEDVSGLKFSADEVRFDFAVAGTTDANECEVWEEEEDGLTSVLRCK